MATVEFRDPPRKAGAPTGLRVWTQLRELKAHPGQWGVIAVYGTPRSAASFVRRVRQKPAWRPDGRFEFTVRSLNSGKAEVYGMFIAAPAEAPR